MVTLAALSSPNARCSAQSLPSIIRHLAPNSMLDNELVDVIVFFAILLVVSESSVGI
jgi:hypothetical protein